ncbi:hypothetical protein [Georgenia alba]|uniref:Uncharacterized protein n=1 Tax=Georgenia alba TaxID=2233858 RepID=A0ABW2Q4L2_9MICO
MSQRTEDLDELAAQRGWVYTDGEQDLADRYAGSPFGQGWGPKIGESVVGEFRGRPFVTYEYAYHTTSSFGTGSSTSTHRLTVTAMTAPGAGAELQIARRGIKQRVLSLFGKRDLPVGDASFDRAFVVRTGASTGAEEFARTVLDPGVRSWPAESYRRPLRFTGNEILAWQSGKPKAADVVATLDHLAGLVERIPGHAWRSPG